MTAMLSALLVNQRRVRVALRDAESISARQREAAHRTLVTTFNAWGYGARSEDREPPKPFNTDGQED